jgi:hypothetical protein
MNKTIKDLFENDKLEECDSLIREIFNSNNSCTEPRVVECAQDYISSTINYWEIVLISELPKEHHFHALDLFQLCLMPLSRNLRIIEREMSPFIEPDFLKKYDFHNYYNESIIAFSNSLGEYYLLSMEGEVLYKSKTVIKYCGSKYFIFSKNKLGVLNQKGEVVLSPIYDDIGDETMGMFPVLLNSKWTFINRFGSNVLNQYWENINSFKQGLAFVKRNDLWGLIDFKGNLILEYKFQEAWEMINEKTLVRYQDHLHVLHLSGKLLKIELSKAEILPTLNFRFHGIATVRLDNQFYVINERGETLSEDLHLKSMIKFI